MKILVLAGAVIASLGLAVASTHAQTQTTTSSSTTYIETSKLVGKPVKSSQGEEIGTIKDVVIDRNTGCMAYTVLSTGGGGGTQVTAGGKMVAVPWSVYSPTSDVNTYTVTVERERIYNAPVFDYAHVEEYSRPDYINNVYGYFGVTAGAAIGTAVSSGETHTTNVNATTGAATGAGTRAGAATGAGAAASPGGGTSPAAPAAQQRSPMGTASPAGRASPHATAGRSPHASPAGRTSSGKGEGTPPPTRGTRGTKGTPPPSGREESGSRSEDQRSTSEADRPSSEETKPAERSTGSQHRERGKRETTSPSEKPPGGE